jgi:NADH:ubiquinone oxidoreductase subunit 2 (subunit N)
VVAFYYYAKVIKAAWFDPVPTHIPAGEYRRLGISVGPSLQFALGLTAVGVVLIGFYPPAAAAIGELASTIAAVP